MFRGKLAESFREGTPQEVNMEPQKSPKSKIGKSSELNSTSIFGWVKRREFSTGFVRFFHFEDTLVHLFSLSKPSRLGCGDQVRWSLGGSGNCPPCSWRCHPASSPPWWPPRHPVLLLRPAVKNVNTFNSSPPQLPWNLAFVFFYTL